MADELTLKLKVENANSGKKLEDTKEQLNKIKEGSKEAGDSIGLADTKIGKMWGSFKSGASKGINSMKTLRGAIAATGIGLLLFAVTALTQYFTKSAVGAEKLKVIMAALGQVVAVLTDTLITVGETLFKIFNIVGDVVKGNKSLVEGWKEAKEVGSDAIDTVADSYLNLNETVKAAMELAERENQLRRDRMGNLVEEAKISRELAATYLEVDNAMLTNEERIAALDKAEGLLAERTTERIRLAREQYEITKEQNSLANSTLEDMEKEAQQLADLINAEAEGDAVRKEIIAKRSGLLKTQQAERDAANKAELDRIAKVEAAEEKAYAEEQKRIAQEAKDEADKNKKLADLQAEHEKTILAIKRDAEVVGMEQGIELERLMLQRQYDDNVAAVENSLLNEEQKNEQLLELNELYLAEKNEITQFYADEAAAEAKAKQDELDAIKLADAETLEGAIKDIVLNTANQIASGLMNIQQNRLNQQKEDELSNENLTEEEKAKINEKYAKKQQQLDIKKAIVAGALAVLNALATQPFIPAGLIAAAGAVVATGVQIATIKSQKYALGGMVTGASHDGGGVEINAEGGEYMINKKAVQNPVIAQQAAQLNAGIPVREETQALDIQAIVAEVVAGVTSIPVVVSENQITDSQKNVTVRQERFTVS